VEQSNHTWGQTGVSDRMRDLLARASQDNAYEQRSQDATIDEIRQRLEGLEWLVRELRERELGSLVSQFETVQGNLAALTERAPGWAESLAEHIERLGERVTPVAEVPTLSSDVSAVSERVDDALGRLQTLTDATQRSAQQIESFTDRMEQLQVSMEGAALRFSRLDKALGELAQRSDRLEAQVNTIGELMTGGLADLSARTEQQLGEVTENVRATVSDAMNGSIPQHLDGLKETVEQRLATFGGTVEQSMESLGGRMETLTGRIGSLDGRMEGVDGRVDGVDGRLEGIQGRLDGVEGRFDGVEGRFEKVDGHVENLHGRFEKIDGHFDGVGGRFEKVDGHVESLQGRLDQLDGHFEGIGGRLHEVENRFDGMAGRFEKIDGRFEGIDGKVDAVDDRLEAVNQRIGQLPATLDMAELRKRLSELAERPTVDPTERLDALDQKINDSSRPITDAVRARPDREEVEDTVSKIVDAAHGQTNKQLTSLEETVIALAEALLRPTGEGVAPAKPTGKSNAKNAKSS